MYLQFFFFFLIDNEFFLIFNKLTRPLKLKTRVVTFFMRLNFVDFGYD